MITWRALLPLSAGAPIVLHRGSAGAARPVRASPVVVYEADAGRLSSDAVLEPDRPPADADHRRGDRGRRRGVPDGLRVGLDRPSSPVASHRVASAVADARPAGPGDGPDAAQDVD